MHSLFRNISVLTFLLASFNSLSCQDIEEGLETRLQAIKTLHHGTEDEKFKVLTSLDEWGITSALSMARISFLLINDDKEWLEDEVEQNLLHKYREVKAATDNFELHLLNKSETILMIDLHKLPKSLSTMAVNIKILDKQIQKLLSHFEENNEEKEENIQVFLKMYENIASEITDQIYFGMVDSGHNIFQEAAKEFKYDIKETLLFIKASILLLQNTVTLDVTYKMLKEVEIIDGEETDKLEEILESNYGLWLERFKKLVYVIKETEAELKNAWKHQSSADIDELLETFLNGNIPHLDMSSTYAKFLVKMLTEKYPWRRWSVVVTNSNLRLKKEIDVTMCDKNGYSKYNALNKKHVFVSSTDINSSEFNRDEALNKLKLTEKPLEVWGQDFEKAEMIKDKMLNYQNRTIKTLCPKFSIYGVLQDTLHSDVAIQGTYETTETYVKHKHDKIPFKSFIVG